MIRTTNIKMKLLSSFVGFILLGSLVAASKDDISSSIRNAQYLPTAIQELPIHDDVYKTQVNKQQQRQKQQKFEEANYGNSRYHVFEVHNNYKPSSGSGENIHKSFRNNNYSPSQHSLTDEIHIEHVNAPADFPLDDPNFDASFLNSFLTDVDDSHQEIILHHKTKNVQQGEHKLNVLKNVQQNILNKLPKQSKVQVNEHSLNSMPINSAVSSAKYQEFKGPDYLPPQKSNNYNSERFKRPTHSSPVKYEEFSQPQHNFVSKSFLNGPFQQNLLKDNKFKSPDYLPPHQYDSSQPNYNFPQISSFKNSDYLPPHQHGSEQLEQSFVSQQTKQNFNPSKPLEGPDYLPPTQAKLHSQTDFRETNNNANQNLALNGRSHQHQQHVTLNLKSPEYLPPQQTDVSNYHIGNTFKGPEYLPPNESKNQVQFKGPDYLPPQENQIQQHVEKVQSLPDGYDFQKPLNSEEAIKKLHTLPESEPQYKEVIVKSKIQVSDIFYGSPKQNEPFNDDFKQPENSKPDINVLQNREPVTTSHPFKTLEYFSQNFDFQKPAKSAQVINQSNDSDVAFLQKTSCSDTDGKAHSTPSYIPPDYDFQKPVNAEAAINQLRSHQNDQVSDTSKSREIHNSPYYTEQYQTKGTQTQSSPQVHTQQGVEQFSQNAIQQITQQSLQQFKGPNYLPPSNGTPNFKGPDYIPPLYESETFKGPEYLPPTANTQVFQRPEYLPPKTGSQSFKNPDYLPPTIDSQNEQNPEYLTPIPSIETAAYLSEQQALQDMKGPVYFPSADVTQQTQFKISDYIPLSESITMEGSNSAIMYPLSSFMTNVKPNDRYGNSKLLPEYGEGNTIAYPASNEVSTMYRESTSRPQYYAPTMSYTSVTQNQYQSTAALNQQARQALETLMPADIRQTTTTTTVPNNPTITPSVAATTTQQPTAAKIRTVQIVSDKSVKNFKVLESLDHTGAKTIKILGPSHEEPKGDHRVVKVVSGSHEQNVQTVKIFDDHQDASPQISVASAVGQNNGYLAPRYKRDLSK